MHFLTPEPHMVPGYQGHCPQYNYYVGGTYAHLTHRALLSPCVPHGQDVNLTKIDATEEIEMPSKVEKAVLEEREKSTDVVFRDPIIPGYTGFVPKLIDQVGKRYLAAATSAVVEHENLMDQRRCDYRNLVHYGILQGSDGLFVSHMQERLMPRIKYRAPLVPVSQRRRTWAYDPRKEILPYSRFTAPHFKEDDDEEKFIINGYCGHIPNARSLFGTASKVLSHAALSQFTTDIRHRRYKELGDLSTIECRDDSCRRPDCEIYRKENNMIAKYSGHVPGRVYQVGQRSAVEMLNAKHWLETHRLEALHPRPPRCGELCH